MKTKKKSPNLRGSEARLDELPSGLHDKWPGEMDIVVDEIRYKVASFDLANPEEDMIAIPRWMLRLLADELAANTSCGGKHDYPGCPRCEAITTAKLASECVGWPK